MENCSPELQAIKTAILNEHEGYRFYQLAAEKGASPEVRNVFLYLAQEEKKHEDFLRKLYGAVEKNQLDGVMEEAQLCRPLESPHVFSPEHIKNEETSLIVSALAMAVKMEKDSAEFYREAAAKTDMETVRQIFLQLADWENQHLDALNNTYDFAREEWWAQQGFSPA
ncbi:MAG: ferritin family protein [Bacillota bacterium]